MMRIRPFFLCALAFAAGLGGACTQDFDQFSIAPAPSGAGGGGTGECTGPDECPAAESECQVASCVQQTCGFQNLVIGSPCAQDGGQVCDAAGACVECNEPADCAAGMTCVDKQCFDAACFNTELDAGETDVDCGGTTCPPCANDLDCLVFSDCESGFCDEGTCAACATDEDCEGTAFCGSDDICTPLGESGEPCALDEHCESGFCPDDDGVCCDTACDSECEACVGAKTGGQDGVCAPVPEGDDPDNECEQGCISGQVNGSDTCDGEGSCGETVSCELFTCNALGTACNTVCQDSDDCATVGWCDDDECVQDRDLGDACDEVEECPSDFCTVDDGVCCNEACGGICETCSGDEDVTEGEAGECAPVNRYEDPDGDCDTGEVCDGAGQCMNELESDGVLVRYFIDEAATGSAPLELIDDVDGLDLPIDYDGYATYVETGGNRGLFFNTIVANEDGAAAAIPVDGTALEALESMTATIEVVVQVGSGGRPLLYTGNDDELGTFTLFAASNTSLEWRSNSIRVIWGELDLTTRCVVQVVIDTTEADEFDRVKLYVDGVLAPPSPQMAFVAPDENETIDLGLGEGRSFVLGNNELQDNAMDGHLYYVALYDTALDLAAIANNAEILLASDDKP